MKFTLLALLAILILAAVPVFAADGACGCKIKVVDVHEEATGACHQDEVMVSMVGDKVECGSLKCDCACHPESDK